MLIITDSAIGKIANICSDGSFLRITVKSGGCYGFSYFFNVDNAFSLEKDEIIFSSQDNIPSVIASKNVIQYINGSTVDYVDNLDGSYFVLKSNPQATSSCGCGNSFSI